MGLSADEIATIATFIVAIIGLTTLFKICQPIDVWRGLIWSVCLIGFVFCVFFMPKFFAIAELSKNAYKVLMMFVVFAFPVLGIINWIITRLSAMRVVVYERSK